MYVEPDATKPCWVCGKDAAFMDAEIANMLLGIQSDPPDVVLPSTAIDDVSGWWIAAELTTVPMLADIIALHIECVNDARELSSRTNQLLDERE